MFAGFRVFFCPFVGFRVLVFPGVCGAFVSRKRKMEEEP